MKLLIRAFCVTDAVGSVRWGLVALVLSFVSFLIALPEPASAQTFAAAESAAPKVFLIGNSLTWDTLPGLLSGDVDWHVDCGKSLQHIYDHPEKPCVPTSKNWPTALKHKKYDFLVVQPHYGSTLSQDVGVIERWLELQPEAILVIHTGWARHVELEKLFQASDAAIVIDGNSKMVHSPKYFAAIEQQLHARRPNLQIRSTNAIQVLESIGEDIKNKRAPVQSLTELYRDDIHWTVQNGRYLAHNLMRRALGQPRSTRGFQLEPEMQTYLDAKLAQVPQTTK